MVSDTCISEIGELAGKWWHRGDGSRAEGEDENCRLETGDWTSGLDKGLLDGGNIWGEAMFSLSPVVDEHILIQESHAHVPVYNWSPSSIAYYALTVYIASMHFGVLTCDNEICNIFLQNTRVLSHWKFSKWSCYWRLPKNHFVGAFFQSAAYLSIKIVCRWMWHEHLIN